MNKTENSELKESRRFWIVLAITFILVFIITFICLVIFNPYQKGYQTGVNDTLNNYTYIEEVNSIGSLNIASSFKEPEYVGFLCDGNYITFINETFVGCKLKR